MHLKKLMILCGGRGTRLSQLTNDIPKPMVNIGDMPILWHIMKYYYSFGIKEFILCVGYKSEIIREFFINYQFNYFDSEFDLKNNELRMHSKKKNQIENWKIIFSNSGIDNQTGSRIYHAQKHVKNENFYLTYGDGIGNIDINKLTKKFMTTDKILTISGVRPPARFGELKIKNSLVTAFNEKPQTSSGLISGGFFVCKPDIFQYLNSNKNLIFENEPMNNLVKDKQVSVYTHNDFWQPMDTYREYKLLNFIWSKNKAKWKKW